MARLVWFLALVVGVITVSGNAIDIQGVLPLPEGDDIKIEDKVASIPALELTKSKPIEIFKNGKDLEPETILQPIGPIFPSFFQPGQMFGMPHNNEENESAPKHGILTIILVKNKHASDPMPPPFAPDATQFKENLLHSAEDRFQSLTQFLLNDLFGIQSADKDNNRQIQSEQPERVHLLGGRSDPDHFRGFGFKDDEGSHDFIRFMKNNDEIADNMGRDEHGHHGHHGKKCNFMKYLKLKAHIHYRTIVHLVFISGILLMILLMISLTIKVHKRRNALRRYAQQNINVSSIDSALTKHQEATQDHHFRSGILRTSYEQKQMPSVFISGPPAYEKIDEDKTKQSSSLIQSLVMNYKKRYQRMAADSELDDDRKSITSLPEYEEKPEPKQ